MLGDLDLLGDDPTVRHPPVRARLRRVAAVLLVITLAALLGVAGIVAAGGPATAVAPVGVGTAGDGAPPPAASPTTTPSALLERMLGVEWQLLELSLRPDGPGTAVVSARFAAPTGAPALPERLLAALDDPALTRLVPVAITATADGTAVDLAGPVAIDGSPLPGGAVAAPDLAGRVSAVVGGAGARVRGVRRVDDGRSGAGGVVAVTLDAPPAAAVAALRDLERGPSAPARMTTLLVRHVDAGLGVELLLTARTPRGGRA